MKNERFLNIVRSPLAVATYASTLLLTTAGCAGESSQTDRYSFSAVQKNFKETSEQDEIPYLEVASGKGEQTVELTQGVTGDDGKLALIYGGRQPEVSYDLMQGKEVIYKLGQPGNGGGSVNVTQGYTIDTIRVTDAAEDTQWALYLVEDNGLEP